MATPASSPAERSAQNFEMELAGVAMSVKFDPKGALQKLRKAKPVQPVHKLKIMMLEGQILRKMSRLQEAAQVYDKAEHLIKTTLISEQSIILKFIAEAAETWEALADAYTLIPEYGAGPLQEYLPLAQNAIKKALEINPDSAPALTTSAYIKFMYDYDFRNAETEFAKAISIDTNYATAHQWYGELLAAQGHLDAALDELRLARRADPLAPILPFVMGWILTHTDRTEEAVQYFQEALELNPNMAVAYRDMALIDMIYGRFELAREHVRKQAAITAADPSLGMALIDALENPALRERALTLVIASTGQTDGVMGKSSMLMLLEKPELAVDYLEKGFEEREPYAVHMKRMNIYDPLRENPRYQTLLKKMNMWP